MYLSEVVLELPKRANPYDLHRQLWKFFELPPGSPRPFQFRVEQLKGNQAKVLMQSSIPTEREVEGARVQRQKPFAPVFSTGQRLRFRLKANPIKTIKDEKGRVNSRGKTKSCRVPLIQEEQQLEWLTRKLDGAATIGEVIIRSRENIYFRKGKRAGKVVAVTFEGMLQVQDQGTFAEILAMGIGPAKGLGCGMLSLAPA